MGKATVYCKECGFSFETRTENSTGKKLGKMLLGAGIGFFAGGPVGACIGATGMVLVSAYEDKPATCPKCGAEVDRPKS